jgi:hypothetical protein
MSSAPPLHVHLEIVYYAQYIIIMQTVLKGSRTRAPNGTTRGVWYPCCHRVLEYPSPQSVSFRPPSLANQRCNGREIWNMPFTASGAAGSRPSLLRNHVVLRVRTGKHHTLTVHIKHEVLPQLSMLLILVKTQHHAISRSFFEPTRRAIHGRGGGTCVNHTSLGCMSSCPSSMVGSGPGAEPWLTRLLRLRLDH